MAKPLNLQFSLGGVVRRTGYQSQPPYTARTATNCGLLDSLGQMVRGGSRYGQSKTIASRPASDPTIGLWPNNNAAASALNMIALSGTTSSNPRVYKYASGSWSAATVTQAFQATDGKRVVAVPMPANTGDGVFSPFAPGDLIFVCANWTNTVAYDESAHAQVLVGTPGAVSAMQYAGRVWYIKAPRAWDNGALSGVIDVPGSSTSNEPLTGCIAWIGGYALFFTAQSTTCLTDDPELGGTFICTSQSHGMLDPLSWCRGPNNELYVLNKNGLVRFNPGAPTSAPELLSEASVPASLKGLDAAVYQPVLAYDPKRHVIHIRVSKIAAAAGFEHFVFQLEKPGVPEGWWPETYATDHDPFCVASIALPPAGFTESAYTSLVYGCRDGYLRWADPTSATDDGTAITSSIMLGPFYGYDSLTDGIVSRLQATLGAGSGTVAWSIHPGRSAEEAFAASAKASGNWTAGPNPVRLPRVRCFSWFLKLSSTARWAFESGYVEREPGRRFVP